VTTVLLYVLGAHYHGLADIAIGLYRFAYQQCAYSACCYIYIYIYDYNSVADWLKFNPVYTESELPRFTV